MSKKDHFLQQLQRRQTHLKQAPSHVDKPSEKTLEQLEVEQKRLEMQRTKSEIEYWEEKRQAWPPVPGPGLRG